MGACCSIRPVCGSFRYCRIPLELCCREALPAAAINGRVLAKTIACIAGVSVTQSLDDGFLERGAPERMRLVGDGIFLNGKTTRPMLPKTPFFDPTFLRMHSLISRRS